MRVLIVADIHGNRAALEAIREPFDACVCVGDLVDYGPEPGACIEWVRENVLYCVRGNHDHGVAQAVAVTGVAGFRYLTSVTRPMTVAALSPHQRRYLADLPTLLMSTIGGKIPLATPRRPWIIRRTSILGARISGCTSTASAGHTHQPYTSSQRHEDREPRQRWTQPRWRPAGRLRDH